MLPIGLDQESGQACHRQGVALHLMLESVFTQIARIPGRPVGIGAVRRRKRAVMSLGRLPEQFRQAISLSQVIGASCGVL